MTTFTPLKKYRLKVIIAPLLKAVECSFELLTPFVVRYIIDEGISKENWQLVLLLSLLLFGFAIVGFLSTLITQYLASRVYADYGYDLRRAIYNKVQTLDEKSLEKFGKDKILNLFSSDTLNMQNGVAMGMRLLVRSPFIILGSMALSFTIHWVAGLIFSSALVAIIITQMVVMYLSPRKYNAVQNSLDDMSLKANDSFAGFRVIRAYDKVASEEESFTKKSKSYKKNAVSLGYLNAFLNPLSVFFLYFALVLIIYFGNLYVHQGILTTGEIVSLMGYITATLASLTMFSRLVNAINKARTSKGRIDEFLALEKPAYDNQNSFDETKPLIEVKDLGFAHDGKLDHLALKDCTFNLNKGERIGLIGGTGSGKSTLVYLLSRLYAPTLGEIKYLGLDYKDVDEVALRNLIHVASQKPSIFKGSIRDNLLIAKPDASDEELLEALKKSLAYEFVSKYDDLLDHQIVEGGANLSGGQKQRLALARVFLDPKPIIILDDCLSALDYLSEKKLRENLFALKDSLIILVSQRTSSLVNCDHIFVLNEGEIIARGQHEELIKTCSLYKEIYETQRATQ